VGNEEERNKRNKRNKRHKRNKVKVPPDGGSQLQNKHLDPLLGGARGGLIQIK
jgi:hypothetical protein